VTVTYVIVTQRRSIAKNVGCFQRRLFVCGFVSLTMRTSKHRMMKLWIAQKSRPSSNLGVIAPRLGAQATPENVAFCWVITQNVNKALWSDETSHRTHRTHRTCVLLGRWENQRRLSSLRVKVLPADDVDSMLLPPGDGMLLRVVSRLHIWPVQDSHAGRYQCVASNQLGSSYSARAVVTVNGMLSITVVVVVRFS